MDTSWAAHFLNGRSPSARTAPDHVRDRATEGSEITLLNRIAAHASAAAPLNEVLRDVLEFVAGVANCDSCVVYVLEGEELVLRASRNPHPEVVGRLTIKVGQGITAWLAEHREPVMIACGAYEDPRFKLFNELTEDRYEAFWSFPLISGGRLVGVINLQNRAPNPYSAREVSLIATIGFLLGAKIEIARLQSDNSKLLKRLETRALVDRAKVILRRDLNIKEDDAHRTMQRESQNKNKTMREIAEAVILTDELKHSSSTIKIGRTQPS